MIKILTYTAASELSIIIIILTSLSTYALGEDYPQGSKVRFQTLTAEDIEFARKNLERHFKDEQPAALNLAISEGEIEIARAHLDDDGAPEAFIMVRTSMWCGSQGCHGLLLQYRGGQWKLMAMPIFSEEATIVMPEKRFGYHKLYTGECIYTFRNDKTYEIIDLEDGSIIR